MPILWRLKDRVWRYNELKRDLKRVTHKMLTEQLRDLEQAQLVTEPCIRWSRPGSITRSPNSAAPPFP